MGPGRKVALSGVRKIAVLRPSALGDFIFALPALQALRRTYPHAEMVYLGRVWHRDFLKGHPGIVDRVLVVPPCLGIGLPPEERADDDEITRFLNGLREEGFDIALQMYGGGAYSNPFVSCIGARLSAGLRARGAQALDLWLPYGVLQNRRLQLLEVVALVGAEAVALGDELHVAESDRREVRAVLPTDDGRPLIVIQPGASDPRRRWPAERFAAVADGLAALGARIAVHGSADEVDLAQHVVEAMRGPAWNLAGKLSISGLCGLLECADLLVSNDTGPLHLALAVGTPSVGIYWFGNLIESGPLRQSIHWPAVSSRRHCPVCGAENWTTRCAHDCSFVDDVAVDEVEALAREAFFLSCS